MVNGILQVDLIFVSVFFLFFCWKYMMLVIVTSRKYSLKCTMGSNPTLCLSSFTACYFEHYSANKFSICNDNVIWKNYILKIMQTENKFIVKMTQHFRRIFLLKIIHTLYT